MGQLIRSMSFTAKSLNTYDHVIKLAKIKFAKSLYVCFFLSRQVAECTLTRNKMNCFDFSKWLQ